MSLVVLLLLPFAGSVLAALMPARSRTVLASLAGFVSVIAAVWIISLFPRVRDGGMIRETVEWVPSLGLELTLRIDGFAWMFAVLVTVIGALVSLYARYYMSPEDPAARFYSFFLAFMGSMLGVVIAGNLIQLVIFWELTSLVSFVLIGYWHHREDAQQGARMALIVTGLGGLALLGGVIVVAHIVGSYDVDIVLAAGDRIRAHALYPVALVLVLIGAFTKSAQFPFHFWLSRAMAAPTPVSAYLHSATMVKAGVFLLARLWPVLAGTELWAWLVGGAGLVTLVLGAYIAMFQHDLKRVPFRRSAAKVVASKGFSMPSSRPRFASSPSEERARCGSSANALQPHALSKRYRRGATIARGVDEPYRRSGSRGCVGDVSSGRRVPARLIQPGAAHAVARRNGKVATHRQSAVLQ